MQKDGDWNGTHPELQGLIGVIKENLAEIPPMGEIELEEHLAPQCNVPPEIVPSGQTSVDSVSELLQIANGQPGPMLSSISIADGDA